MTGSTTAVSGGLVFMQLVALAALGVQDSPPPTVGFHVPKEPAATTVSVGRQTYEYLGTKRCRMCHVDQYKSWRELPKGRSWEALKPGIGAKVKVAAGLDVSKDYRDDGRCLKCHCVGYGRPGGYVIPDPSDGESVRLAAARQGVGCEACHGPGSGFVQIMQDIYTTDRTYKPEELYVAGRRPVGPEVCAACHNKDALCMVVSAERGVGECLSSIMKVDVKDRSGYHAVFPLKHRAPLRPAKPAWPGNKSKETDWAAEQIEGNH